VSTHETELHPYDHEHDPDLDPEVEEAFVAFTRHHRKKKKGLHLPGQDVAELNLTAMMDMMTILLVFLLNSYGNEPDKFQISDTLRPPESSSQEPVKPSVVLTVSTTSILFENQEVVKLGEVVPDQPLINPLLDVLSEQKDHLKKLESMGGQPFEGTILIVAHRATPYNVVSSVLYTAGRAEFGTYRLVVLKGKE
jgi:biopolymer transport protein ExbD